MYIPLESSRPRCDEEDAKFCEQLCFLDGEAGGGDAAPMCECYSGYYLREDDRTCEDVDECAEENGGCEHLCINKPGTFMCDCAKGYQTMGTYCMDINECLLNNGHGPCQDKCRYYVNDAITIIAVRYVNLCFLLILQESRRQLRVLL